MKEVNFLVDTQLATLLSQQYSSSERALKELVDNAWDADAELVTVTLPAPMSGEPIVIEDNGSGMTEQELQRHYLVIANDRRARSGDLTQKHRRKVKGRKGIGKFAGLMAANEMTLETWARGKYCLLTLRLEDLAKVSDIEQVPLPIIIEDCDVDRHGTRITLAHLKQELSFPTPLKMRQVLLQEYGREENFVIKVDGKCLDVDDVSGIFQQQSAILPKAGAVELRFSISDKKGSLRLPGITLKVNGKSVGKPFFFGLDEAEDFPPRLLKKVFGEIHVDGLVDHITAGWDAVVENSDLYSEVKQHVEPLLREAFREQYGRDMQLSQARLNKKIHERLAKLPEYKRVYADRAIKRILGRYYEEPESKSEPVVSVLLDALENSDYRVLLEHINDCPNSDVAVLAESLNDFGLAELAIMFQQAQARMAILDNLELLCRSPDVLESVIHKALEHNLWIFGHEYLAFSSNRTLKVQVEDFLGKKYEGDRANQRPDLVMNENLDGKRLLIEFKRPSASLGLDAYQQATAYRHEFRRFSEAEMQIILLGGRLGNDLPKIEIREKGMRILTYVGLISAARRQLDWLLTNLGAR